MMTSAVYVVFAGNTYYPVGGALDAVLTTNSIQKAMEVMTPNANGRRTYDWAHIAEIDASGVRVIAFFGLNSAYSFLTTEGAAKEYGTTVERASAWYADECRETVFVPPAEESAE